MLFQKTLAGLGLLASLASAAPSLRRRQDPAGLNVVYWGQNGGGTIENNDLSAYCTATSDIDVLVLSSLWQWSNGATAMGGSFGQSCGVTSSGQPQNCDALVAAITKCKNAGVKIILSIGGAAAYSSFASADEASAAGQYVWNAYGGGSGVTRPFGNNIVDGFDLDLELATGNEYFIPFLNTLRSNFASDPSHTYVITGAPQCPIPEPNMGIIIQGVQFDYLWIQFYNNNNYTVPCSLGINGGAPFNYNNWTSFVETTPSKNAKLFVGVPASPLGANGSPTGSVYYATPQQLAQIVAEVKGNSNFGGIMMWSAGFSDSNVNNGCNYAQEAKNILLTGSPCASGPVTASLPPVPTSTSASSPPGSSSTPPSGSGSVPQWGQCGGDGYTGPTQCVSPYKCVATSEWWSQCE
ncbi:glycoside hydrolase family 18 protein [Trichoderma atroviride IMI 206040]|uniref:chitinase n=1 Tax=Hypocrea atroviridis (strain ATCC 20476 / IMI 206040) TaxID=452589 RepID=G9NE01_HYPAI|nr:glycoside hydrolase family 18 protein [Trichoderma atroviride IMI 206040]EHK51122.1 glycoside hydrolase family 18 protein [Trichoderma atroviride IMI 206040]